MLGLLIGTLHLLLVLNASVRSVAAKWWLGSIAGVTRVFLLVAVSMAGARVRVAGAEPTPAAAIALYAGPVLTVIVLLLALRRRRAMPARSDSEQVGAAIVRAWLAAAIIDVLFVMVNVARVLYAYR